MAGTDSRAREITATDVGRSILNSIALISTSLILLLVSCVAFFFFYHHNVPATAIEQRLYLQHHTAANPHATFDLEFSSSKLSTSQPYDVIVEMTLPNTPSNHDIGNFMIEIEMLSSTSESMVKSARSAIMQYSSPIIDTLSTVLGSGPVLLGFKEESQTLRVPLLESYEFQSGWLASPAKSRIEVHAPNVKVYDCKIQFRTQLRGLTWFLYTFKISSFLILTTLFWFSSMLFMLLAWGLFTFVLVPPTNKITSKRRRASVSRRNSPLAGRQSGSITPDSGSDRSFVSDQFPRMTSGSRVGAQDRLQRRSVAASSVETQTYFKFDDDDGRDRESAESDATTMEGDPYIKVDDSESEATTP